MNSNRILKRLAKPVVKLCAWADWSEHLLVVGNHMLRFKYSLSSFFSFFDFLLVNGTSSLLNEAINFLMKRIAMIKT